MTVVVVAGVLIEDAVVFVVSGVVLKTGDHILVEGVEHRVVCNRISTGYGGYKGREVSEIVLIGDIDVTVVGSKPRDVEIAPDIDIDPKPIICRLIMQLIGGELRWCDE